MRVLTIFKIRLFTLIDFTNKAPQNTAKRYMTKQHPKKTLATTRNLERSERSTQPAQFVDELRNTIYKIERW